MQNPIDEKVHDRTYLGDTATAKVCLLGRLKKLGTLRKFITGHREILQVFDTNEESATRKGHAWMADYPDGTIFLATSKNAAEYYGENVPLFLKTGG